MDPRGHRKEARRRALHGATLGGEEGLVSLALAGLFLLGLVNAVGLYIHWAVYQANRSAVLAMRAERTRFERLVSVCIPWERPRLELVQDEPRNGGH